MQNQRNRSINPLLINTSRQFYSRRVPPRSNSNGQIDRVLKLLNLQSQKRQMSPARVQTQTQQQGQPQVQTITKVLKIKVQSMVKKEGKDWQELFQFYEKVKRSSSKEMLAANDFNFLAKFQDILKKIRKQAAKDRGRNRQDEQNSQKRIIQLENIKLLRENQLLRQKITLPLAQQTSNKVQIDTQQQISIDSKRQKSQFQHTQIQQQLQTLRQANQHLRQEKRNLYKNITQLKIHNQNLCDQILQIKASASHSISKINSWKSIMSMEREEILSLTRELCDLRKTHNDLHKKYQNMLQRIGKLTNSQNKIIDVNKKSLEVFTEQVESFIKIRVCFINQAYLNVSGGYKDNSRGLAYKKYMNHKQSLGNVQAVKKTFKDYCRYFRPSFFIFLQKYFQHQGIDRQNFDKLNIPVDVHFLATLRAILDSKHNEYLLSHRVNRQFSNLASFTISWLSNYSVDLRTKRQKQTSCDLCYEIIGTFYMRLMSPSLNANWQVITFRQMLLDTLTVDELLFYLKARFILLKGNGLSGFGAFQEIYYVNYRDALCLVQQVVSDLDYRKKLEKYIKNSADFKTKKHLIDAHFILRLLLEFYQFKKKEIFDLLAKAFSTHTRQNNNNMTFQVFLKIFDYNFCELAVIDKVEIYQKAFSLGRGIVTIQSVFTVITEEGFLYLQVEKLFAANIVTKKQSNADKLKAKSQSMFSQINQVKNYFEQIGDKQMRQETANLGVQFMKVDQEQKQINYDMLFIKLQRIFHFAIFNLRKMFFSKKIKQTELAKCFVFLLDFIRKFKSVTIQRRQLMELAESIRKKNAARVIMRFYRRKKGRFNYAYILTAQKFQRNNQKSQYIRKQFNSLIFNLKNKYSKQLTKTSDNHETIE